MLSADAPIPEISLAGASGAQGSPRSHAVGGVHPNRDGGDAQAGPVPTQLVTRDWLHSFASTVRNGSLASVSTVNSCVLTTRLGLRVLERVGVSARAFPVFVSVHNRQAWDLASSGVPIPEWPNSAHSVGVNESVINDGRRGWAGHLVLLVKQPGEPRVLIDLTADQFDRPIRNLVVGGPVFMDIPAGSPWTPQDPLYTVVGERTNPACIVSYRPMPPGLTQARSWVTAPDWVGHEEFVEEFIEGALDRLPPPGRATVVG
jgi:hypothetical protein